MANGMGRVFQEETREFRDEQTGSRILQLTDDPSINHHLYFLTPSLTPDESVLVFASYRTGRCEYFKRPFPDGDAVQLTDEAEGVHGYSGVITPDGRTLLYTAGGAVRSVDLENLESRTLGNYEGGQLGECSLSADGRWIVTAIKRGGRSGLAVTAVDGSSAAVVLEIDRTIIHPQFHPTDPDRIAYSQDPAPRMWWVRRDGTGNECLYEHGNDEFLVHETFLGDGSSLIVVRWPYALLRFDLAERLFHPIAAFNAWHIGGSRDGRTVLCDTAHPDLGLQLVEVATGARRTVCHPRSSNSGSQWLKDRYALAEDWAAAAAEKSKALSWMEMKTDTVYGPQWPHPHPSFSPSERWVLYTSDVSGSPQVYAAELGDAVGRLPR
jgi:oligogalacturonide lyase